MSRYVEVPAQALEQRLQGAGFTRTVIRSEVAYQRQVPNARGWDVRVTVYTSLRDGAAAARACGKDAIRVATIWYQPGFGSVPHGLSSETKVLRTGTVEGVLDRMVERAREAWVGVKGLRVCAKCGAPAYQDSGRCVVRECREQGRQTGLRRDPSPNQDAHEDAVRSADERIDPGQLGESR